MRLQNFERERRQTRSVLWVMCSLVPRPVRAIRVTRGGLELPTSLAGDVSRDVTSEIAEDDWERGWVMCKYNGEFPHLPIFLGSRPLAS